MYFVCERARQDVKVALIGQGPDELFGGYTRHWVYVTEVFGDTSLTGSGAAEAYDSCFAEE